MPDLTLSSAMDSFLAKTDPATVFLPISGGTMTGNLLGTNIGADDFANKARDGAATFSFGVKTDSILNLAGASCFIDMYTATLNDSGTSTVDWCGRKLNSGGGTENTLSVDWTNRQLIASDGTSVSIDWYYTTPEFAYGAKLTPTPVASLVVGNEGIIAYVNDAWEPSIGAAVAGGGSAKCLVCFNGTSFIVTATL